MPQDMATLIVGILKVVNQMLNTWVNLGAPQPLTSNGSILVNNLAQTAVAIAHALAQVAMNNPI